MRVLVLKNMLLYLASDLTQDFAGSGASPSSLRGDAAALF